jgi:hypothetical protein
MPDWIPSRDAIFDLPPEMAGGLTFHLPMELVALEDAGATVAVLEGRTRERLVDAYATGLVDPPLYRWAEAHYADAAALLLSPDATERLEAFESVHALGDGLAGAAFHGLIRLGYAAWKRDQAEMARGLAYLRTRRQVLAAAADRPAPAATDDTPPASASHGATVFDLLNIVAGTGQPGRVLHEERSITAAALVHGATGLVRRNPSSFVAVHALTGFHALCEVHHLVCGEQPDGNLKDTPMWSWWRSYAVAARACSIIVEAEPPEALAAYDNAYGSVTSIDSLVASSVLSGETHDVKVAVALRRLVGLGLLDDDEAVATGVVRLAAGRID